MKEIRSDDVRLIEWRSEISNLKTVCLHQVKKYLTRYQSLQKSCCSPFQTHAGGFSSNQLLYATFSQSDSKEYINKQLLRDVP